MFFAGIFFIGSKKSEREHSSSCFCWDFIQRREKEEMKQRRKERETRLQPEELDEGGGGGEIIERTGKKTECGEKELSSSFLSSLSFFPAERCFRVFSSPVVLSLRSAVAFLSFLCMRVVSFHSKVPFILLGSSCTRLSSSQEERSF